MRPRMTQALATLLAAAALLGACAQPVTPRPPSPSPVTPQATSVPPTIQATDTTPAGPGRVNVTVTVVASAEQVRVGETISVTVSYRVNNPDECRYPLYEASLEISPADPPVLRLDTPARVGPPGPNPARYQLTAVAPGEVRLRGVGYGEQECGGGWQWTYVDGVSPPIKVIAAP